MNHKREISKLTKIAKPQLAVITNVGTAHIGNLGSRENILKIEEWDFPREMLERTINKIEADGVTFKYQKDAEWEKAGYEDPNAD